MTDLCILSQGRNTKVFECENRDIYFFVGQHQLLSVQLISILTNNQSEKGCSHSALPSARQIVSYYR